jgi:hypothetical protein
MRYLFGTSTSDFVIRPPSSIPAIATSDGSSINSVVVADASRTGLASLTEGGPPETDLTAPDGVTPVDSIMTDEDGFLIPFRGPDEVRILWLSFDDGVTWFRVISVDAVAAAADYTAPVVVIGPADTEPPFGTPVGTLVFREVF